MEKRAQSILTRETLVPALIASFTKLDPRIQFRNPVMFVVEIGAVITTFAWLKQVFGGEPLGGGDEPAWFTGTRGALAVADRGVRQPGRGARRGPRQGPGRRPARDAHRNRRPSARRRREVRLPARSAATWWSSRRVSSSPATAP